MAGRSKSILFSIIVVFSMSIVNAQQTESVSPDSTTTITDKSAEKPEIEDATILAMIDGLTNTPLYENSDRVANLAHIFVQWVTETDKVTIELLDYFSKITETNKMLSIPFFCGWVKAAHDNNWQKSNFPLDENTAAIKSTIEYYRKNESKLIEDSFIIELEEKLEENKLKEYLKGEINFGKAIQDLINSDINDKNKKRSTGKDKTVFIVNRKEVSKLDFGKLDPTNIENMTVVKGEDDIKKYTDRECDGIVIVRLKENKL